MPLAAWALNSYSWTIEYCCVVWHSAHLPVARTMAAEACDVSTAGRCRLTRNPPSDQAEADHQGDEDGAE